MHKIIKIILAIIISIVLFFAIVIIAAITSMQNDKSELSKEIAGIESVDITDIESSDITDIETTDINPDKYNSFNCDTLIRLESELKNEINSSALGSKLKEVAELKLVSEALNNKCDINNKYNNDNYTCANLRGLKSDLKDDIRQAINWSENLQQATRYEKERDMVVEAFNNKCNIEDYYEDVSCKILKKAIDDLKSTVRSPFGTDKQYLNEYREELDSASNVYDRNCNISDQYENLACEDLVKQISILQNDIQILSHLGGDSETLNDKLKERDIMTDIYAKKC